MHPIERGEGELSKNIFNIEIGWIIREM